MTVFLNGAFVPEENALVSVFDRGFLYGDGLFETLRIHNGEPFLWQRHVDRLARGANFLGIRIPYSSNQLLSHAREVAERHHLKEGILRISLSRGVGIRGYSSTGADSPTLVMSVQSAPRLSPEVPPRWRLITSSVRIPARGPLSEFKTSNKLMQILARSEAEARGADDALLLNTKGEVAEASSSNFFWIENNVVLTPPLTSGALAGVTRELVLELCAGLDVGVQEKRTEVEAVLRSSGAFVTLSRLGIVEVTSLDAKRLPNSPLTRRLYSAYLEIFRSNSNGEMGGMD